MKKKVLMVLSMLVTFNIYANVEKDGRIVKNYSNSNAKAVVEAILEAPNSEVVNSYFANLKVSKVRNRWSLTVLGSVVEMSPSTVFSHRPVGVSDTLYKRMMFSDNVSCNALIKISQKLNSAGLYLSHCQRDGMNVDRGLTVQDVWLPELSDLLREENE